MDVKNILTPCHRLGVMYALREKSISRCSVQNDSIVWGENHSDQYRATEFYSCTNHAEYILWYSAAIGNEPECNARDVLR